MLKLRWVTTIFDGMLLANGPRVSWTDGVALETGTSKSRNRKIREKLEDRKIEFSVALRWSYPTLHDFGADKDNICSTATADHSASSIRD